MEKLRNGLITQKYTTISHEDKEDIEFNTPHLFIVEPSYEYIKSIKKVEEPIEPLTTIKFQKGAIKEHGVNGVCNEDLIAMVICRLQGFQNSEFKCRENSVAITKLEESLMWLRKRTMDREVRNVEGTHIV